MRPYLLLVLLTMSCGTPCLATDYHLDSQAGDDTRDGTSPATAWQSLARAEQQKYHPGDRLLFKAGSRWVGSFQPQGSGSAEAPITIASYGDGPRPILDGDGVSGYGTGVLRLHNQQHWTITSLEVVNQHPQQTDLTSRNLISNNLGKSTELGNGDVVTITGESNGSEAVTIDYIRLISPSRYRDTVLIEAENTELSGMEVIELPGASGGRVATGTGKVAATFTVRGLPKRHRILIELRIGDESDGASNYYYSINQQRQLSGFKTQGRAIRSGIICTWDQAAQGIQRGIRISDVEIHHIAGIYHHDQSRNGSGIQLRVLDSHDKTPARLDDVLIERCVLRDMSCAAFALRGPVGGETPGSDRWQALRTSRLHIRDNYAYNLSSNGIVLAGADETCLVERNLLHDVGLHDTGNTFFTWSCRGTVFQFNEVYNHMGGGEIPYHEGCMYDADGKSPGTIWQYSYSHNNANGLIDFCGNDAGIIVRYNLSQNDRGNIVQFSQNPPALIHNNVFYIGKDTAPRIINERRGANRYQFYNNAVINHSEQASYTTSTDGAMQGDFSHNAFIGLPVANQPADPHAVTADPMMLAPGQAGTGLQAARAYQIRAESPLRDTARPIDDNGGRDYFGNPLTDGAPDIGLHEWSGNLLPLPTEETHQQSGS